MSRPVDIDQSEGSVDPSEGGRADAVGPDRQGDEASAQAGGDGPNDGGEESMSAQGINPVQHSE